MTSWAILSRRDSRSLTALAISTAFSLSSTLRMCISKFPLNRIKLILTLKGQASSNLLENQDQLTQLQSRIPFSKTISCIVCPSYLCKIMFRKSVSKTQLFKMKVSSFPLEMNPGFNYFQIRQTERIIMENIFITNMTHLYLN